MQLPAVRPGVAAASVAITAAVVLTVSSGCTPPQGSAPVTPPPTSVITSVTEVAGADVLGNQRRPDESCPAEPAPPEFEGVIRVDSGAERGEVDVAADPQRIVALSADQLDALCALGLQSRVVAAATATAEGGQPSYLGTVLHDVPAVGAQDNPDRAAISDVHPDLILGSTALQHGSYGEFADIAPTVFTGAPGADWRDNLRAVGAATGRTEAAAQLVENFDNAARDTGVAVDATHFQVSVLQFTEDSVRVFGANNFPASVLAVLGADRPAAQRFTDSPSRDIAIGDGALDSADFSDADGDIVYVSFASAAARDYAPTILDSEAWRKLSAARDNRVFIVNNEVWQTGRGLIAARGILEDVQWLNAPIN